MRYFNLKIILVSLFNRFLLLNYFAKIFFTIFTYTITLVDIISVQCLELVNFPWYLLYTLFNRMITISEMSTFIYMSFAKVILNWRPDVYVRMNSTITVDIATFFAISLNLCDLLIRINLHVVNNCEDRSSFKLYQAEFQREFCFPKRLNKTENITQCISYDQSDVFYKLGCEKCSQYPTLFILAIGVIFLETIKFFQGFVRVAIKNKSKQDLHLKSNHPNNSTNREGQTDDIKVTYNEDLNISEDKDNTMQLKQESVKNNQNSALESSVTQQIIHKSVTNHSIFTVQSEINQINVFVERDTSIKRPDEKNKISNIITVKTKDSPDLTNHTEITINNIVEKEITGEIPTKR